MRRAILWLDGHKLQTFIPIFAWVYFTGLISMVSRTVTFAVAAFWVTVVMLGLVTVALGIAGTVQLWGHLVAWAERPSQIAPHVTGDPLLREAEAEVEKILGGGTETP